MVKKESLCMRCKSLDPAGAGCTMDYLFLADKHVCQGFDEVEV